VCVYNLLLGGVSYRGEVRTRGHRFGGESRQEVMVVLASITMVDGEKQSGQKSCCDQGRSWQGQGSHGETTGGAG
jgi:hypothetical protein